MTNKEKSWSEGYVALPVNVENIMNRMYDKWGHFKKNRDHREKNNQKFKAEILGAHNEKWKFR